MSEKYPLGELNTSPETRKKEYLTVEGGARGGDIYPELQAIIDAWPRLSDDVRASILAMASSDRKAGNG